ncbi:xanthine dehydrogenase family protein molybdopterin-binding subunit [Aureimonas altamirensis]|uniref:xanthine dehydrogenase family protein molybdopterin-binding subunit n=1 Tax=Aureimonas altamirensis TaxID=370622 RepID=UPI001E4A9D6E|nr:xanthine dehydrogenase family protein molybdopterin-binding subunit [Aureimonas altamirensis]UHD46004.1 xanthine dehydrogenase family protein molybdopterin-binding subunit [Aureimonas altamirensis]
MTGPGFAPIARVDAQDKVRGRAIYGTDRALPRTVHAVLATAKIARGSIRSIATDTALAVPGVRLILTHEDVEVVEPAQFILAGQGYGFQSIQPLATREIGYKGQPVAVVVADTLEAAMQAVDALDVVYDTEAFQSLIDAASDEDIVAQQGSPLPQEAFGDKIVGDADAAIGSAPVQIDASYVFHAQHQNPIELISTVAHWRGERLVVHEGTQNAGAIQHGLARQFGIDPALVEIISPHAGGGFGQKNSMQSQTFLAAVAARRLGRPVKLVMTREQIFHTASFRPAARHRVRLGATRDGHIVGAVHEVDQQTSRHDLFPSSTASITARLHGIANFRGSERLVRTDVQTPGYMRAPFEHSGTFAFETAIDELAYALSSDPVALRLANDATADPLTGRPFTSRFLAQCLTIGAERFGWSRRRMAAGSMSGESGELIGWGVACGAYKAAVAPAIATIEVHADGAVVVSVSGHEMGQGLRTVVANVVSRRLGIEPGRVDLVLGETRGAAPHLTAGSWGTATAIPAVEAAIDALDEELRRIGAGAEGSSIDAVLRRAGMTRISSQARSKAPGQPDAVYERLVTGLPAASGPVFPDFVAMSYIAHFIEVRVERSTRRISIPRVVSVADCGRVVSPVTAASQVRGGVVGGIGGTLMEISEVDPRHGGFLNADLAEYVVPVNADIGDIEVHFVDEPDPTLNTIGAKGLGEVAMTGVGAAIANAIHHATGRRHRRLPIRIEDML